MGRRYELIDPACPCWHAVPQYLLKMNCMELDNDDYTRCRRYCRPVANEGFTKSC
jgi:hypothetical protein